MTFQNFILHSLSKRSLFKNVYVTFLIVNLKGYTADICLHPISLTLPQQEIKGNLIRELTWKLQMSMNQSFAISLEAELPVNLIPLRVNNIDRAAFDTNHWLPKE